MTLASIEDWATDFASVLAETYCLHTNTAEALAYDMEQVLSGVHLPPRPNGVATLRVLEQATMGASYERMAVAEQIGQGMGTGLRGQSHYTLASSVWAGFFCGCLALAFDLRPDNFLKLIQGLSELFDAYEIPDRPVQVLSLPLIRDLPIDLRSTSRT